MTNKREKAQNITDIMQQIQQKKSNNMANFKRQLSQDVILRQNQHVFFKDMNILAFFILLM